MPAAKHPISQINASRALCALIIGTRPLVFHLSGWLECLVFHSSSLTGPNQAQAFQGTLDFSYHSATSSRRFDFCRGPE